MIRTNSVPELSMAQKLKMLREINNLTQEQLGQKLNVSEKTVSAWENNEREITLPNAKLICELFSIPQSYFVFNENYEKLDDDKKVLISDYIRKSEYRKKIEDVIVSCKKKMEEDGVPFKKEYLPKFDYEKNKFVSYGIFDLKDLNNKKTYAYDSALLAKYGLYDILERFNQETIELKDLTDCNNVEIFRKTLLKMKSRKYTRRPNNPIHTGYINNTYEVVQDQLNEVLENLNPNLSKYWEIVVFLIDNGAYYTRQVGWGDDVVCWEKRKDISKTNLVYRIAKDKIEK